MAIVLTLGAGILSGCSEPKKPEGLSWIDDPQTREEWINNAKIKSLTSLGNTYRLKKAIEKARNGEDVTIAYIGGSITEGDNKPTSYANRSFNSFTEAYAKKSEKMHIVNAGISGTPSVLGSLRAEKQVGAFNPDIVFIEFAVNDGSDEDTKDAFDSLVRECLQYESKPAVILLFARMEAGWTSQDWKKLVGAHYDLPMISYADGITYMFDNGGMEWSEFSGDYTHPNEYGNEVVASFIEYFFQEVDRSEGSETDIELIEPLYAEFYMGAHLLERSDVEPVDKGTWRNKSSGFHFDNGWTKSYDDRNEPLVFEFTGKHAYVVYPASGNQSFGTLVANVYLDGELVATKEFSEYVEGGWMCPYVGTLHRSPKVGNYRIEFTAKEDNVKCDLQVLGVAYTDK